MARNKMVMVLLALGSNAEFKYPRYFQSAPFGPIPGVLSNAFFEVARSLTLRRKRWRSSAPTPNSPTTC
jgi:branched-chain amino acid transport system substrate-binding protein